MRAAAGGPVLAAVGLLLISAGLAPRAGGRAAAAGVTPPPLVQRMAVPVPTLPYPAAGVVPLHAGPALAAPAGWVPRVDYDIVYVRAARHGDAQNSRWTDTFSPLMPEPGADLVLLHPNGREEVLVDQTSGAVQDPNVSYDGRHLVFCVYHNQSTGNDQRGGLSYEGADVYRLDLQTRAIRQLTFGEFTPNTGNGAGFDPNNPNSQYPRVGVFNTGPCFLPDGRIVFTSTRNNFLPPKQQDGSQRVMQLFTMDGDGANVEQIGYLNLGAAMHPYVLADGRISFTSWENQGLRDSRQFALWVINPDGTGWTSLSGFSEAGNLSHHFATQVPGGDIVTCAYYLHNNNGFGELFRYPLDPPGPDLLPVPTTDVGGITPMDRKNLVRLTPFTSGDDFPAPYPGHPAYPVENLGSDGTRVGKFTHPMVAPNGNLLVVYSPGPCNHNGIYARPPYYDGGIYLLPNAAPISAPSGLVKIKNDPRYNEQFPRPVVPYSRLMGIEAPAIRPRLRNDGQSYAALPEATPFALIGSASLTWRDTRPYLGDPPNQAFGFFNWALQGADAGVYADNDIYALRVLAFEPLTDRSYPDTGVGFGSAFGERVRILGEIPVRKPGVFDYTGAPDTSFLAKVPADLPLTFQTLDQNGRVLNMAQTWHQLRPGEKRVDCGGCHAHTKTPVDWTRTAIGRSNFTPADLTQVTPLLTRTAAGAPAIMQRAARCVDVEYFRDVQPILKAKCVSCHRGASPPAGLDLNADSATVNADWTDWPGTYYRLAHDFEGRFGPRAVNDGYGYWWGPNLSRYVRAPQSRQSLLMWKVCGARLDGRTNAARPTERVPGDATTLPAGADPRLADLDYTGTRMPPPGSGFTPLSADQEFTLARWIDTGCGIQLDARRGWSEDDLRPTLALTPTVETAQESGRLTRLRVGAYDLESGIASSSLAVSLSVPTGMLPAGSNLAAGHTVANGGVINIDLPSPVSLPGRIVTCSVRIRDLAGHQTEIRRQYRLP